MTEKARVNRVIGSPTPRISPPTPIRHGAKAYKELASRLGYSLYPWQETAAKYLTAKGAGERWLFREVAAIVARQNGKTMLLVPLIVQRLLDGDKVMHTAQNAKLPRDVHEEVATLLQEHYPERLPRKRAVSYAVGHEEIKVIGGGRYRIVAPTKGGARGPANDLVIVDELREMEDYGFIGAARPTLTHSRHPQMIYLSNAGTDESEVLNGLRLRASEDPSLAYLEWSAEPTRAVDDIEGWREANPAMGHDPAVLETLTTEYRSNKLTGTLSVFETEHLCRWVATMREQLVDTFSWVRCHAEPKPAQKPYLAVSMDPRGQRVSAVLAWQDGQEVRMTLVLNETGNPIDTDAIGKKIKELVQTHKVHGIGFDPLTDAELVKYVKLPKPQKIAGAEFANASAQFRNGVDAARIRWHDADAVTDDLTWTSMKPNGEGAFHAVRALDERPITASLAAIRAVWLASGPPTPTARVWT